MRETRLMTYPTQTTHGHTLIMTVRLTAQQDIIADMQSLLRF